ncbi:hypothetical protein D3C71_1845540 [compost metagenome]
MAAEIPAVFYHQSAIADMHLVPLREQKLTFTEATTSEAIAEWERRMRSEVGLNADISNIIGTLSISGCGGVGGGNDDCDNWN